MDDVSNSMEMYLVSIARLRQGDRPVPLSSLAESLDVTTVSVNEMCRKLQDQGLLVYRPYKGAALTIEGNALANAVLRRHRLWEVFLVEKLGFDYETAHRAACNLEHVSPNLVINRLDQFLGFPKTNPIGDPIPQLDGRMPDFVSLPLASLPVGMKGILIRCDLAEDQRQFLFENGISTGVILTVMASGEANLMLQTAKGRRITISRDLADFLLVRVQEDVSTQNGFVKQNDILEVNSMALNQKTDIKQIPLSKLKSGQRAVVVRVGGAKQVKRRMMDMGMVPGSEVKVIRVAPFGDPVEFSVKGYSLSLRKSEAEQIQVELMD